MNNGLQKQINKKVIISGDKGLAQLVTLFHIQKDYIKVVMVTLITLTVALITKSRQEIYSNLNLLLISSSSFIPLFFYISMLKNT